MKWNSVFTEKERQELQPLPDKIRKFRKGLVSKGLDPSRGAIKDWEFAKVIIASNPMPEDKVLDVGSSISVLPFWLKKIGCKVVAVDVVFPADCIERYRGEGIEYNEASIFDLPFPDNYFDKVYSVCVLEHIYKWTNDNDIVKETIRAFREVARVLKPGGVTANTCDFYIEGFNTWRTFHEKLLLEIIDGLKDIFEPVDEPDYHIADPFKYYIQNSTVYNKGEKRRKDHLYELTRHRKPENLFTMASIVLRKINGDENG